MKKLISLLFGFGLFGNAFSQPSISPSTNNEYCPDVEYTFTVTITKSYQSIIGIGSCIVTQVPTSPVGTTFTFKGKFGDANQKQTFRINYSDQTFTDFDFKRIRSLFYPTTCIISPNVSVINASRCQVVNTAINFSNIQWGTAFESPSLCFGSISTYEYLLPTGWSIGTNVSNGTNWIAGGNSVIVTSDLSNGVNGFVRIRPVNNCASGLINGQSQVVQIPISRPAPTLSVSGADIVCSGSSNYSISGLPSGASVCWSISDPSIATIPSTNCSNTIDVTKVADGFVTLSATVTHCAFTYGPFTKQIVLGTPKILYGSTGVEAFHLTGQNFNYGANGPGNSFSVCPSENLSFTPFFPSGFASTIFGHSWSISGSYSTVGSLDEANLAVTSASAPYNNFSFSYQYQNACGWSPFYYGTAATIDCAGGQEPFRVRFENLKDSSYQRDGKVSEAADNAFSTHISIYPNPVKEQLIVNLDKHAEGIKVIRLVDATGRVISSQQITGYTATINFSGTANGIYYVEINHGKKRVIRKVIK